MSRIPIKEDVFDIHFYWFSLIHSFSYIQPVFPSDQSRFSFLAKQAEP